MNYEYYATEETTTYRLLLDSDVREFNQFMEDGYTDMQWEFDHPFLFKVRTSYQEWMIKLFGSTWCKWFGCKIEMDGYADGDTGWEDWCCLRCWRGGRHIYY